MSLVLAALHAVVIAIGPPAYRYFGRADLGEAALRGSLQPAVATVGIAMTLAVWGLYAFSGAGLVQRLPFLRTGLVTISVVYTLRGLVLVLDFARWMAGEHFPPRQAAFSAAALAIGLGHAVGTRELFRRRGSV